MAKKLSVVVLVFIIGFIGGFILNISDLISNSFFGIGNEFSYECNCEEFPSGQMATNLNKSNLLISEFSESKSIIGLDNQISYDEYKAVDSRDVVIPNAKFNENDTNIVMNSTMYTSTKFKFNIFYSNNSVDKLTTIFIMSSMNDDDVLNNDTISDIREWGVENGFNVVLFDLRNQGENNDLQLTNPIQFGTDFVDVINQYYEGDYGSFITIGASVGADAAAYACSNINKEVSREETFPCQGTFNLSPYNHIGIPYSITEKELQSMGIPSICVIGEKEWYTCEEPLFSKGEHGWNLLPDVEDLFHEKLIEWR